MAFYLVAGALVLVTEYVLGL